MSSPNNNNNTNNTNNNSSPYAPPQPTCLFSRFSDTKVHNMDLHPVKPWLLFASKHGHVYLYDYEQNDILHSFSLNSMYESKREEAQLLKILERNYNNVSLPDWYDDQLLQSQKLGDIKSIRLLDEDVIHWKLFEKEHLDHSQIMSIDRYSRQFEKVGKSLQLASSHNNNGDPLTANHGSSTTTNNNNNNNSAADTNSTLSDSFVQSMGGGGGTSGSGGGPLKSYVPSRRPKCIVLHTETRVIMLRYDEVSSSVYFFDEVKSHQLDKHNILCMEFFYSHPIIALGMSDGSIRLWNYKTREVLRRTIVTQSKIAKMIAVHREDGLSNYPLLLTIYDNGSLAMWSLETGKAEYTIPKGQGLINDAMVDWDKGHLITIGNDRSIFIRKLLTGEVIHSIKLRAKNIMQSISKITTCNCIPSWFLMISDNNRKLYQISADLNESTYSNSFDVIQYVPQKKQARTDKIYTILHHPLQPNVVFVGTNFGLLSFKMDATRSPPVVTGIVRQLNSESSIPTSSFSLPAPTLSLSLSGSVASPVTEALPEGSRFIYYVKNQAIFQRTATIINNKECYSEPVKVQSLPRLGNVQLSASYSGRYLAILWEKEQDYEIYNTSTWKRQSSGSQCTSLVWSAREDRFAVLKSAGGPKQIAIYCIVNNSTHMIIERANVSAQVKSLFGGVLLGVLYQDLAEEAGFHFLEWTGDSARGELLPKPKFVEWDSLTAKCIMVYDEAYAVFEFYPEFRIQCYVKDRVEAVKWWNSTLFIANESEIKCIFPTRKQLYTVVLASFNIAHYANLTLGSDEDSLDPIPQPRPKGNLSFVDVVGDSVYVLDTNCILHTLSLDTPSLKFRTLAASGLADKALSWIPYIPQELHDYCADFLVAHLYPDFACQIETMTPSKRFQLCIEYGLIENGYDALTQIDVDKHIHNLTDKELAKLFIRLASVGERQIDYLSKMPEFNEVHQARINDLIEILERSYKRATELDPSLFVQLIVFYTKHGETDKLKNLKQVIQEKKRQATIPIDWDNVLTMLGLFTQDFSLVTQFLPTKSTTL